MSRPELRRGGRSNREFIQPNPAYARASTRGGALPLIDRPVAVSSPPSPAARAEWRDIVARYQPSVRRSVTQLAVTALGLAGAFVAMHLAMRARPKRAD
jgi:hypothetical protein